MIPKPQQRIKPPAPRGSARPGGRTERVRKSVLGAVLQRLAAGDLGFTFQDIASIAGVHVATIYSRWPERASLVMAAYEEHVRKLDIEFSGDWEADLHKLGIALRDFLRDPIEVAANKLLLVAGEEAYRGQMMQRFESVVRELARPLEAAKKAGLVRRDVDSMLVVHMILSPLLAWIMFTDRIPDDTYVRTLVDHMIRGCRA